ncbi:MAG: transmembrane 220 family protein [Balneolaceae bacterium]|nr:transmembrane 220 family protein [Balneolaceae bacterium]
MAGITYKTLIVVNYVMAVLFLFAAGVQFNDPDGIEWILLYGSAAVACLLYATGRYRRFVPVVVLLAALVWAGFIFPAFFEGESFSLRTFSSVRMTNMEYETAREFGGLMVVSIWMAVIAIFSPASRV